MSIESPLEQVTLACGTPGAPGTRRVGLGEERLPAERVSGAFRGLVTNARNAARGGIAVHNSESFSSQMFEPAITDSHERRKRALREDYDSGGVAAAGADRMDTTSVQARGAKGYGRAESASAPRLAEQSGLGMDRDGMNRAASRTEAYLSGVGDGRQDPDNKALDNRRSMSCQKVPEPHSKSGSDVPFAGSQAHVDSKAVGLRTAHVVEPTGAVAGGWPIRAGGQQPGTPAQRIAQSISTNRVGHVELARAVSSSPTVENAGPHTGQQKTTDDTSPSRAGRSESSAGHVPEADKVVRSEFDRLVRSIRLRAGERHSSARLHLDPPELGRIQVDVRMEGAQMEISVRTETSEARELLSRRAAQLRAALQHYGIHVDRFDVTLDSLILQGAEQESRRGSGFAASSGRDGRSEGMGAAEDSVSSDDTVELAEVLSEPANTVVRDGRLDIRV